MEQRQRAQTFEDSIPLLDNSKKQCSWPFGSMSGELLAECGFVYAPRTAAKANIKCVFCNVQHGAATNESESKSLRQTVKHILKKHLKESPTCLLSLLKYCTLSNSFLQFYQKDISMQDYQNLQKWTFSDSQISKDAVRELIKVGFLYYLPIDSPTFIESTTGKKEHYGRNHTLKDNIEDAHLFCPYCNKAFNYTKQKKKITENPYDFHLRASPKCYFLLNLFTMRKDSSKTMLEVEPQKQLENIAINDVVDDAVVDDNKEENENASQKDSSHPSNAKQIENDSFRNKTTLKEVTSLNLNLAQPILEKPAASKKRKLLLGSLTTKIGESLAESSRSDDEFSRESRISIANLDTGSQRATRFNGKNLQSTTSQNQPDTAKSNQVNRSLKSSPIKIDFFRNINSPKKNHLLDSDNSSDTEGEDIKQIERPGKVIQENALISTTESATASPNRTLKRKLMAIPIPHDDLHSLSDSSEEESYNAIASTNEISREVSLPKEKPTDEKVEQANVSTSFTRQPLVLNSSYKMLKGVRLSPNTRPSTHSLSNKQEQSDIESITSSNASLNSEFQNNGKTNTSSQGREVEHDQLDKIEMPLQIERLQQGPIDTKNMDGKLLQKAEASASNIEKLDNIESQFLVNENNVLVKSLSTEHLDLNNVTNSANHSALKSQLEIKSGKTKSPLVNLKNSKIFTEKTTSNLSNAVIEPGVVLEEDISPVKMTTNINIDSSPLKSTKQPTRNINATLKNMQKFRLQTTLGTSALITDEKPMTQNPSSVARTSELVSEKQKKLSTETENKKEGLQLSNDDSDLILASYLRDLLRYINQNDATLANDRLGELHYFFQSMPNEERNMTFEDWLECQCEKLKQDLLHLHEQKLGILANKFKSLIELVKTSEENVLSELAKELGIANPVIP